MLAKVLVNQEQNAGSWRLPPLRTDPLGQASISIVCVPKQEHALPRSCLVVSPACYSGWHCSHTAEHFMQQQLQHDLIFFFPSICSRITTTLLSKLHDGKYNYPDTALNSVLHPSHFELNNATYFIGNVQSTHGRTNLNNEGIWTEVHLI